VWALETACNGSDKHCRWSDTLESATQAGQMQFASALDGMPAWAVEPRADI